MKEKQIQQSQEKIKRLQDFVDTRTRYRASLVEKAKNEPSNIVKLTLANKIIQNDKKIAQDNEIIEESAGRVLSAINFEDLISGQPLFTPRANTPYFGRAAKPLGKPVEQAALAKEKSIVKTEQKSRQKMTLRFKNGKEMEVIEGKGAKTVEKLISRRREKSRLIELTLGEDNKQNRINFETNILPRARQIAGDGGYKIELRTILGQKVYSLQPEKPVKTQRRQTEKKPVAERMRRVKTDKRATETYTLGSGEELKFTPRRFKILERLGKGLASGNELKEVSGALNVHASILEINQILKPHNLQIINVNHDKSKEGSYVIAPIRKIWEESSAIPMVQISSERPHKTFINEEQVMTSFRQLQEAVRKTGVGQELVDAWIEKHPFLADMDEPEDEIELVRASLLDEDEIIDVPYVPEENELRTEEENRIATRIIFNLRKSENLDYATIQRELRSESRVVTQGRKAGLYELYGKDELIQKVESGLKKIKGEETIAYLKEKWSDEDKQLWKNIEASINKYGDGNFNTFLRILRKKVTEMEKNFYILNPTRDGQPLRYIDVKMLA